MKRAKWIRTEDCTEEHTGERSEERIALRKDIRWVDVVRFEIIQSWTHAA